MAIEPEAPGPAFRRAVELARAGRTAEAEGALRELLRGEPRSADAWFLLGSLLATRGEAAAAADALRRAVDARPALQAAWRALGNVLAPTQPDAAQEAFRRATALRPDDVESRYGLARALQAAGRLDEAIASYRETMASYPQLALAPRFADAHANYGLALHQRGSAAQALEVLERAVAARPGSAEILSNLAAACIDAGRYAQAERHARAALGLAAGFPAARNNLAFALHRLGRTEEALDVYRRALEADPDDLDALRQEAQLLHELGRLDEAAALYGRALERDPASARTAYSLSQVNLVRGDFAAGWRLFEARFRTDPPLAQDRGLALPRFTASDWDRCKRLAVWGEQGVGDRLVQATVVPDLEARGLPFVLEVDRRLLPAFARAHPSWRLAAPEDSDAAFAACDFQIPGGSLAGLLRPSLESFPRDSAPLLAADPERLARTKVALGPGPGRRIAISWRSFRAAGRDPVARQKSAPLEAFRALSRREDVTLLDLQYGDTAEERAAFARAGGRLTRLDGLDLFDDLDGVLAAIAACDLVITTSNVTAHFAGALGKETWLLYLGPAPPFFYWAPDRNGRSLWYPSVEIFGDRAAAGWPRLLEEAEARLLSLPP